MERIKKFYDQNKTIALIIFSILLYILVKIVNKIIKALFNKDIPFLDYNIDCNLTENDKSRLNVVADTMFNALNGVTEDENAIRQSLSEVYNQCQWHYVCNTYGKRKFYILGIIPISSEMSLQTALKLYADDILGDGDMVWDDSLLQSGERQNYNVYL